MSERTRMLLVEDDRIDQMAYERHLEQSDGDYEYQIVDSVAEARRALAQDGFDVVLIDYFLPDGTGLELLADVQAIPAIMVTGSGDERIAVEAMRAGAYDYLVKDPQGGHLTTLQVTVENAIRRHEAERELARYQKGLESLVARRTEELRQTNEQLQAEMAERKEAEAALRERERQYRLLAENTLDVIWTMDLDLCVTYVNPAIRQVSGYTPEEWIGHHLGEFCDEDDLAHARAIVEREVAKGPEAASGSIFEMAMRRKDGSVVPIEVHGKAIFDQDGVPIELQGTSRDISERKAAEQELRRSEARYRALFETMIQGVVYLDKEGEIIAANPAAARILGLDTAEIKGRTPADPRWRPIRQDGLPFPPEEHPAMVALETGEPVRQVVMGVYNPTRGDYAWININAVPRFAEAEATEPEQVYATFEDITERVQMERQLRESEERFRRAIMDAPFPVMIHAEGGEVVQVNRMWRQLTGYDPAEIDTVGEWVARLYASEEGQEELLMRIETLFGQSGVIEGDEIEIRTRDGETRIWDFSSARLGRLPDGRQVVISMAADVTDRKRLEVQLAQAQKMEAIGQLAGGVAHDFNNQLTAITGYTEFLLEDLESRDPRREDVLQIQHAAEHSAALTRQLLAFSRKQVIQPQVLDLNTLIQNTQKMVGRLIGENIKLCLQLEPDLGRIKVDPGQIEQVVMNLAINARDAIEAKAQQTSAPYQGQVTIETENAFLDAAYAARHPGLEPGPYVMLAVSDNGIGMDEETMSHLFEPFFTTKPQGEGTGLGLATVYGIVKQSEGHVHPYSELGRGTTFRVYFPQVDEAPDSVQREAAVPVEEDVDETILVVEDQATVRRLAERILSSRAYEVLVAKDADQAIQVAEAHEGEIDLLLTDVVLPGRLSSEGLVARIKQYQPGIKVLYMSGYTDNVVINHGVLEPETSFIQKPFGPQDLMREVRKVLDAS